ncbi:CotH kinase family protein [Clostridioides difficile]|uniref:CotH kinase family protein n=1 Tax=Clostridioides difficile TaxID=1496 RepID=UPI000F60CBF7|nr:CotH kinase family protein [Clostridioides difficile]MCJ0310536.1 CotH kinase family protein [Clostridioides difficile]MCJ0377811.1 CotH kinase family protein [Clostridioides difficile]MCJ0410560.1 CotH kinase family protein [Clostridioides difficile]MCO8702517.1 CotH kinase family protein [Clostridioides difficile]MDB0411530.1 spore coat protein [Clostridioides difficile]
MKDKKFTLLISIMIIFLCAVVGVYSTSSNKSVDLYSDVYIEKYFNRDKVMEVNIEIDESDLKDMNENAIKEEFKVAKVTVDGDTYGNVGIRTKGNSSLISVANSDSDRYSYKINFDKYNTSQSMEGLTQLNLNNCYSDPSYMREFLTYSICEEMGLATPEFAYAKVSINGEYHGLYLAVEGLKESYLENNFGNVTGDLYKSDEGSSLQYKGDDPESYSNLIVESDKKTADWSKITKLLKSLDTGEDIEKYLDVDSVLKNIAINTALLNLDSYQGSFAHNYYLYEQDGVFSMLPWDFNMSFGGFSGFGGGSQSIAIDEPTTGNLEDRPLISSLLKNKTYKTKYHKYLEEIVTKYLDSDYLENMTTKLHDMIASYVKEDPTAFYTYEEFEKNITSSIEDSSDNKGFGNKGFDNNNSNNSDSNNNSNSENKRSGNQSDEKEVNAELTSSVVKANTDNETKNKTTNDSESKNNTDKDKSGNDNNQKLEGPMGKGGKSIPGVLEVAEDMSKTIKSQLSGETSSTKQNSGDESSSGIKGSEKFDEDMSGMPEPPEGMDGKMPPGMGNMDKGDMNGKNGNMNMDRNQDNPREAGGFGNRGGGSVSKTTTHFKLILGGASMIIMSIMLVGVSRVKRRRFIKSK